MNATNPMRDTMPTGYTEAIKDGITFRQFALRCARGCFANILMHDENLDSEIHEYKVSNYHLDKIKRLEDKLYELEKLTPSEQEKISMKDYKEKFNELEELRRDKVLLEHAYRKMLAAVNKWKPPTDEHYVLKKFMIEQIKESIEHDCFDPFEVFGEPKFLYGEDWYYKKRKEILDSISNHKNEYSKEVEDVKRMNEWNKKLFESLPEE
ncbi:MAG: hypothetical protein AMQ22_00606 [Candidatus Methanofastidiosum methylothiophilum]|uniref:Uncharacterized protein n=1 Tax=Candidatus Methanofastidiosum methylothiophilum TaxID=1705564 RepID=A0A150J6R8_9EURY|nr:MAG: hypothetical protein AMQ22_00606 [Candidatus Methanofastidiosum methylthiophilus]